MEKLPAGLLGQADAAGRILIGHDEGRTMPVAEHRQVPAQGFPPRPADDVPDNQDAERRP